MPTTLRLLKLSCLGGLLLGLAACAPITDGTPVDPGDLGHAACANDLDCGPGRHCDAARVCALDCRADKKEADCSLVGEGLTCSPCGRCVAPGTSDVACLSALDTPCAADADCSVVGTGFVCGSGHTCVKGCDDDQACKSVGRGWGCEPDGVRTTCQRVCSIGGDCAYHGWAYACQSSAGADGGAAVRGACVKGTSIAGFSTVTPSSPPAAAYQGVWGWLANSGAEESDVPIYQTICATSAQHLLVKAAWAEGSNDLTLSLKWCDEHLENFRDAICPNDNPVAVLIPDLYLDALRIVDLKVKALPALAAGAAFDTDRLLDIRGVDLTKLTSPEFDPLPDKEHLETSYDQDLDGHPGLTVTLSGGLSGDRYQALRWLPVFHANAVDADHLQGLATGTSDESVLGASTAILATALHTQAHPDPTRTFFRAQRLRDDASCADVIALATDASSWIAFRPAYDASLTPPK